MVTQIISIGSCRESAVSTRLQTRRVGQRTPDQQRLHVNGLATRFSAKTANQAFSKVKFTQPQFGAMIGIQGDL